MGRGAPQLKAGIVKWLLDIQERQVFDPNDSVTVPAGNEDKAAPDLSNVDNPQKLQALIMRGLVGKVDPEVVRVGEFVTPQNKIEELMQWKESGKLNETIDRFEADLRTAARSDGLQAEIDRFKGQAEKKLIAQAPDLVKEIVTTFLLPGGILSAIYKALRWLGGSGVATRVSGFVARIINLMTKPGNRDNVAKKMADILRRGTVLLASYLFRKLKGIVDDILGWITAPFRAVWQRFQCWLNNKGILCGKLCPSPSTRERKKTAGNTPPKQQPKNKQSQQQGAEGKECTAESKPELKPRVSLSYRPSDDGGIAPKCSLTLASRQLVSDHLDALEKLVNNKSKKCAPCAKNLIPTARKQEERVRTVKTCANVKTKLPTLANTISKIQSYCGIGSCWMWGATTIPSVGAPRLIENLTLGMRMTSMRTGEPRYAERRLGTEIIPELTREIRLFLPKGRNDWVEVHLLRNLDWLRRHEAEEGGTVFLKLPEMGAWGYATVLAILPCPAIEDGPGCVITGLFRHPPTKVLDLLLDSESKVLGVTPNHLIWSVDRQEWVPVEDLKTGERLSTLTGTTTVVAVTPHDRLEPVYNIEVEGDHVYRVGESGVLVHNVSNPCSGQDAGFANRVVDPEGTRTFTSPQLGTPPGEPGDTIPSQTFTVTVPKQSRVKVTDIGHKGSKAREPLKWAFVGASNTNRIGLTTDTVGHVIGRTFGGNGRINDGGLNNLIAQTEAGNNQASTLENELRDIVRRADVCDLCLQVTLTFRSTRLPLRPSSVRYEWWIEGTAGYTGSKRGAKTIFNGQG